jgi:hypothetical protein
LAFPRVDSLKAALPPLRSLGLITAPLELLAMRCPASELQKIVITHARGTVGGKGGGGAHSEKMHQMEIAPSWPVAMICRSSRLKVMSVTQPE